MRSSFILLFCLSLNIGRSQVLVSDSLINELTVAELQALGVGGADFDVEVYKVRYNTLDAQGQPAIASGAMVIPLGSCYFPLACYHHGTIVEREAVPSRLSQEITVGYYLGGSGYVCVLPDYLGLGDSPIIHPYMHAATESGAAIDLMRAAREYCAQHTVQLNGQIFLAGYSQGGHASMATHKAIQEQFSSEFNVTANAPCSGPYQLSGVQAQAMIDTVPYPAPYYLPYIVYSYASIYPDLAAILPDVFQPPYDVLLPPLFDGVHTAGDIDAVMPDVPSQALQPAMLQAFSTDPQHPFRLALQANDNFDWTPQAPVWMFYCEGDGHVFYENTMEALQAMTANNAPSVMASSMGASNDHGACAFPALFAAKAWFDGLKGDCTWDGISERSTAQWTVQPNPATDAWTVQVPEGTGTVQWTLSDAQGHVLRTGSSDGVNLLRIAAHDLSNGSYIAQLIAPDGVQVLRMLLHR
ncbi:MAG: T9SS type A sorting domain-containing protein [Flavobacteriales bacterium]